MDPISKGDRLAWTLVLAGSLAACAGPGARTDFDRGVDFAAYRTVFVMEGTSERPASLPRYDDAAVQLVAQEIAAQLGAKGLRTADRDQADLWVRFTVTGRPKIQVQGTDPGWGWDTWYGEGDVWTRHYVEGAMVIDMFDRARDRVVWHGWARTPLFEDSRGEDEAKKVIDAILSGFPPG